MQQLMLVISWPGEKVPYLIGVALLVGYFWIKNKHHLSFLFLFSGYGVTVLVQILKHLIKVPRPIGALEEGYGFPSQHAAGYVVVWGILMFTNKNKLLRIFGALMIFLVGVSRVYLGEHTSMDVMGGYFVGSMVLWLSWWWISRHGLQMS
jgi:undecaprenyl-diphosphatase